MLRLATSTGERRIEWNDVAVEIGHVRRGDKNQTERRRCQDRPRPLWRRELSGRMWLSRLATSATESRIEQNNVNVEIGHVRGGDENRAERGRCRDWPRPLQRQESSGMTLMSRSATSAAETRIERNDIDVEIGHVRHGDENQAERH